MRYLIILVFLFITPTVIHAQYTCAGNLDACNQIEGYLNDNNNITCSVNAEIENMPVCSVFRSSDAVYYCSYTGALGEAEELTGAVDGSDILDEINCGTFLSLQLNIPVESIATINGFDYRHIDLNSYYTDISDNACSDNNIEAVSSYASGRVTVNYRGCSDTEITSITAQIGGARLEVVDQINYNSNGTFSATQIFDYTATSSSSVFNVATNVAGLETSFTVSTTSRCTSNSDRLVASFRAGLLTLNVNKCIFEIDDVETVNLTIDSFSSEVDDYRFTNQGVFLLDNQITVGNIRPNLVVITLTDDVDTSVRIEIPVENDDRFDYNTGQFGYLNCPVISDVNLSGDIVNNISDLLANSQDFIDCKNCLDDGGIWTDAFGCVSYTPEGIFNTVIRVVLGMMGGVILLRMIILGYQYQFGDPSKVEDVSKDAIALISGILLLLFGVVFLRILGVNILDVVPAGFFGG